MSVHRKVMPITPLRKLKPELLRREDDTDNEDEAVNSGGNYKYIQSFKKHKVKTTKPF